jgi:hypothetical protein
VLRLPILFVLLAATAAAQRPGGVDLTAPDPIGAELREVREAERTGRRRSGFALGGFGLASALAGGAVAVAGRDDPFALATGLGHASWGLVNAALALGLLDLGGGAQRDIERDAMLRGEELLRAREEAIRDGHRAALVFGINLGLDVFYVATGVLLFFLADQLDGPDDQELLRGYSLAQVGQGTFLFVFDLVELVLANRRADRAAAIPFVGR